MDFLHEIKINSIFYSSTDNENLTQSRRESAEIGEIRRRLA